MAGKYTSKKKKEQQKIYSSARDAAYERITGRTGNGQPQKQLSTFEAAQQQAYNNVLSNYDQYKQAIAERQRQQRVLSQYQMNRMQPAGWMNGGPAAQLQMGLQRMQQAKEQAQKQPGFQDWSMVSNLMDPNSRVNALISQRPQEEQDYWKGVRQNIGKAMNKGKGNDRASQLLRPLTPEERLKQRQAQAESMMRVAQGTPISPLQNPRQYAQEVYDVRSGGTYTGNDPLRMNPEQLEAWKKQNQRGLDQATRTDEQQARLHEMTEEAGEQNRLYYELNNRGLPVMRNMNGELYVPDVAEWGGLDSTQFIRKRPEEYYTDDSTKTEYDRMMYDAIHGKGAYDAILYADETTDEDIDAMDAEAEHLWRQLEGGNFNAEERAAQENYYGAFNRENDTRTSGYQRNINLADQYIGNWNRVAELEAGAPEGIYEYDPSKVNHNISLETGEADQLYYYANIDLSDEDLTDLQRYGNLRPEQFMTDAQRNTFNAYYENGRYAEATEYYKAMEPFLRQMKNEYRTLLERRMYNNGWSIPMTLYRIASKPVEGVVGLGLTAAGLLGNESALDTNSELWDISRTNQNIQNTSADAWARQAAEWFGGGDEGFAAQAGRFLNGVFFSMADNLTAFALSGGASKVSADAAQKLTQHAIQFIMSSEATAGTMFEQLEAGVDPTRAAIMSFGSGIIEAITEKYSLEQILDPDVRAVLGTKGAFMKYLGKASFAEGSEEIASDLLDTGLDFIMSAAYGDAPELIRNYEALIAEGISEEEATRKVLGDYLTQLGSDGLAGALSGLLMSGSRGVQARGLDSYQTRSIGSTVVNRNVEEGMTAKEKSGEQYSNFLKLNDAAKMLQPGSEARRIAQEIEADVKKGGKVSMKKAGKLTRAIMQESNEQIGQVADAVLGDTLTQQLRDEGIAPVDAEKYSTVLKNAVETGRMTPEAMLILSQDERARGLWSEIVKSEDVQSARAAQKSVMDLITTPGERAAENIRDSVASRMATARYITEKDAEMQEALAAGEKRTGSPLEVVADGKIGNVTGIGLKEIRGENGTTWAVTAKVETADGTIEVDLNDVLSTNERTAQVLQMVQAENGQSIGEHMTMQLLKIAQNTKDIAGAATDAISIAMDDLLGEKSKVTTLSKKEELELRAALEEDKKAGDAEAAKNQKQLNPGKAKIVLNGVEYGSQKFAQELGKYGAQIRDEANYVARLMKSIGMDVEFYYDNSEEGSARQGAFVGTQGIRLNLAGTFTSDGVHRSVVATAAHEATHWLRANAQEAYRQLQTYALKGLQNANVNVRSELRRIMDNYALYGEHLTMDKAAEEMTAMGCEEIFTNEQLVSDLQAEDPTLYGKVKQAIQHVMNLLRKVAGQNMATSSRRYAQKLRGTLDQLAKVWKITYEAAKGATETGTGTREMFSRRMGDNYDYTKSFEEQVTDSIEGNMPSGDVLLVGETPELFQKIGMPDLPVTIDQRHVGYAIKGNYPIEKYREGHVFEKEEYAKLPEKIKEPVAIIQDPSSTREIIVYAEMKNKTGKPVIMPFRIGAVQTIAGRRVDVNSMKTVFADNDGINMLESAIKKHTNSEPAVYYVNENKALNYPLGDDTITIIRNGLSGLISSIPEGNRVVKNDLQHEVNTEIVKEKYKNKTNYSIRDKDYADAVARGDWTAAENMLIEKMQQTEGITGYRAPHFYAGEHKDIARLIKSGDPDVINSIVDDMAQHVPENAVLVPMPPHEGKVTDSTDTKILAEALSKKTGAPVIVALESDYHPSRYQAKASGDRSVNAQTMGFRQVEEIPEGMMPVFIDNMVGGGQTAIAAKNAIGRGITLAYAQSSRSKTKGVKIASVTYDSEGNLIPLSQRMDPENPSWKFSMQEPVEERADGLIAVHNLSENQLIQTLKEGGITAPSVAVIKARMGHSKYGEISVVLNPSAIDPKKSVKNKLYGTDAWTPTRGNAQIETKLNYEVLANVRDYLTNLLNGTDAEEWANDAMNWVNHWLYEDQTSDTIDKFIDRAITNDGMIAAFEKENGREIEKKYRYEKVHQGVYEESIEFYNAFLNKLEELGMLQEFMEDMENLTGHEIMEKYVPVVKESGGEATRIAEVYEKNPNSNLNRNLLFNKIKGTRWYQQDGRQVKTEEVYNRYDTIDAIREKLNKKEFGSWVSRLLEGAFGESGVYNGTDYFTSAGNRRSFSATHMEPTAENIVKAMYRNHEEKGGEAGGATGLMAKASKEYSSIAEMRKDKERLKMLSDEEYKKLVSALDEKIKTFAQDVENTTGTSMYEIRTIMIEAGGEYAKRPNAATIKRYMEKQGVKLTEEQLAAAESLMKEAQEIPTGYFEAKPQRVVEFESIEKVIIPETASIELTSAMDQRGIPYDTYDGTEEDRLRVLNKQENAMFSLRDDTDYDVRQWMETVPEWSLQTEAEKQLLSKYKSLQMKQRLDRERMRKIDSDLLKLEAQLTEERTGRIEAEETMENALESAGVSVRDGHFLQKDGKIIGKINADGTISLNKGVEENVYQTLRAAGFGFNNKKGIFRPVKSAPQNADGKPTIQALLGKSEAQRQRDALQKRKQDLQKTMDEQEEKLAEITKDEGFGRMMFQQQKVLDDLQNFGTQRELMDYVARMEKKAREVAARIEENRKATEALEKGDVVKRFRELLGTTTAEKTAAELKKEFSSTWTAKQIQAYLNPIILKMKSGQDFQQDIETLAGILVSSDSRNRYEALEDLRGLVITIGKGAQQELKAQNSSLKEVRARLAGTGIQVKYGDRSTLEADIEDLRAEYPMIPELGDEKDALGNFLNWVDSMKSASAGMEFYDQRIAEAMAVITGKAAGAAKGIYMPNDPKAQQQVLVMMDFVKGMNAETAEAQKALADIAAQMGEMQKAGMAATNRASTLMRDVNVAIDYYQKIGKIAADEAKQKKQSAVIEQLKSKHAQEIVKNNEEWRALIQRDKDARAQLDENRKMTRQINTNLKRTFNLLKNPKGLQNIPEYMQGLAREVISKFVDNDLGRGARFIQATQKELTEWRRILDAWEAQNGKFDRTQLGTMDAENVKADVVLADLDKITEGMKQLNAWKIYGKNKLDALQQRGAIIEQIRDAVSEIYTAIRAEGEVQASDRRVAVEDAAYAVAQGTGGKKYREWTGSMGQKMSWLHKAIVSGNMTPEYFFRTLGNQGLSDLWENYHWAENKNGLELKKAKDRLAQIAEEYGYKNWDMKQKIKLNLQSGEVEITLGQMMSLWATWQREKTLGPEMSSHLTHGGFYADVDLRDGLLGRATVEKRAHRVTEEDMDYVLTQLTVDQMNFIDAVVKFMSNDMSELGNAASMQAYGIKLYKESYYFPFQMWDGVKSRKSNDAGGAAAANDRAFHPSFSKSRQHGANNAVMIGDFMQVVTDHIAGMINYATMGLANENLQKVLNAQTAEEYDTKRNTWALIEEAYGREAAQYLRKLQEQLNGGAVHIDKTFYDKLISLFRKNAVAGSLSVALQQPLSYIRAAMMINPKYLARAISPDMWKGSYKEMLAHSGVAVIKDMGRFDMNFGQSAKEFLLPDGKEGKARKVWEGIEEYSTKLPELMDRMTWTRMWSAVKAEQKAQHPEMDVKSDEFLDMCGKRFNDIMRRTQVYDSTLVKSANMRNQNPAIKTLTSFMAEPTLTLNVLADSVRMAKNHEKGGMQMVGKAGATFLLSAVLQAAVKGLMGTGRTPDEKKTWWENFLYRFEYNFLNEADILQLVPGFSDAVTILKGGELKDDAWGALSKMIKATSGTVDLLLRGASDKGTYRDIEDTAAQLVQMFTGVPLKNLMRDGRAMWNWAIDRPYETRADSAAVIRGQATDLFYNADNLIGVLNTWLGEAGYSTNNNAYYARIYEAKKAGDDARAQNMIDYLLKGKGIKQESINSKIAGMAKKDENASAADTAEFLIAEGANAEDYIRDRMRKQELTADEARDLLQKADPTKDADSIWWTVDRIQYQLDTGAEKVSGNYYRLWDAMDNNKATEIRTAVKTMTDHGMEPENIKKQITTKYKKAYLDGSNSEKVKIKDAIEKAYKELGYSTEDADKVINKWK